MLSLSLLVVLGLLGFSHAYPNGAPNLPMSPQTFQKCFSGNMFSAKLTPYHERRGNRIDAQPAGSAPYELVVSQTGGYEPGKPVTVELKGKTATDKFKGFFIYVEPVKPPVPNMDMGSWEAGLGTNAQPRTYCMPGITHTDNTLKSSAKLVWNAPGSVTNRTVGDVIFKGIVVKSYEQFHNDLKSGNVAAHIGFTTEQDHAMEEMAKNNPMVGRMMTMFKNMRPQGGQGGPGGPGGPGGMPFDMSSFRQQMSSQLKNMMSNFGPGMSGMGSPFGQSSPGGMGGGLMQGLQGLMNQGQGGGMGFGGAGMGFGGNGQSGQGRQFGFGGGNPWQGR